MNIKKDLEKINNIIWHHYQLNDIMNNQQYRYDQRKYVNSNQKNLNDKNTPKSDKKLLDLEAEKQAIFDNISLNQSHQLKRISSTLSNISLYQLFK